MARILIVGCGYVGTALGSRLAGEGHEVWGLRRRPDTLPPGVKAIAADVTVPEAFDEMPDALDFVFYLAAPNGPEDVHYRRIYIDGLRTMLEALDRRSQSPRRVFLSTSTAVYAQSRGEWVDETSPTQPRHFSGVRLLEAEGVLAESPFAGTAVRFGGIYGPRRVGLVDRVLTGRAVYRASPPRYTNRIHRDDCAGALRHLMRIEAPETLYLGVDCEPAAEAEVMRWLSGVLGAPSPRPAAADDLGPRAARSNKRCRNQRLVATGYEFLYPTFREGYTAVLAEQC